MSAQNDPASVEEELTPPNVRGTPLRALDLPGLHDFWAVYERHYEEIRSILMVELAEDPEIGGLIRRTTKEAMEERSKRSLELMRAAIQEGAWDPYVESMREQGQMYAQMGMSFTAWFRVTSAFRPHVMRFMMAAFATDTQRLIRAVDAMDHLLDLALSTIGDAYLASQDEVLSRQREAIGELRSRARYQVVLDSIGDGVVTSDPHGNVITLNPAMEAMAGIDQEQAIGRPYSEVVRAREGDRELPWEERHLSRAIRERRVISSKGEDIWLIRPDGNDIPVTVTAAPILENGDRIIGGVNVVRERTIRS